MGPGFFLFNFWAKKYEVIFFNCGENFWLSIVQKIKRTMSALFIPQQEKNVFIIVPLCPFTILNVYKCL